MELLRITNPVVLFALKDKIYPLFEKYCKRVSSYIPNKEDAETIWQDCVSKSMLHDFYFHLITENDVQVGFMISSLTRMPYLTVLFINDYYMPSRLKEFLPMLRRVKQALGADEVWGEVSDNVYELYSRKYSNIEMRKMQVARIKL